MKNLQSKFGLALLSAFCVPAAHADLVANIMPYQAHQYALTAAARVGNVVTASTNLPGIWASASFRLQCQHPSVDIPITGERSFSDNGFFGPKSLTVTSPTSYPTNVGLAGWNSVQGGTQFDCVFYYGGEAKTGLLNVGGGGSAIPIGGDSWAESGSIVFSMIKHGIFGTGGCIQ